MLTVAGIIFAIVKGVFVYVAGALVALFFWVLDRMVGIRIHPLMGWSFGALAAAGFAYFLFWNTLVPPNAGPEHDLAQRERESGRIASVLAISGLFATGVVATLNTRSESSRRHKGPYPGRM